jgi:hypothetical protein
MVSFMIIKITRFPCIVHLIVSHSSENRYSDFKSIENLKLGNCLADFIYES